MLPAIKVYKIDWDFIISNYLDIDMWQKKWHLFVYKDFVLDLSLSQIDCADNKIWFKISCNKLSSWDCQSVSYYIGKTPVANLQRQIQTAMWNCIVSYEKTLIRKSSQYIAIRNTSEDEEDRLRQIAEDFLDDNGVTNDDIREAYINAYVQKNTKVDGLLSSFINSNFCKFATELMLVFANATKDENRIEIVKRNCNNPDIVNEVLNEYEKAKNELEDWDAYFDEAYDKLESI